MDDKDFRETILIERSTTNKTYHCDYNSYATATDSKIESKIIDSSKIPNLKWIRFIRHVFRDVFLPQGYPLSVSSDYMEYQIWDTIQAFCSTINGILTTHAIFKSVGVGDSTATALSATITWILKDGTGMIGRIGFAWWKGYKLDTDCKKWRLVADIINDVAMCLELLLGTEYFNDYSPYVLCCSTGMKSVVGVAGSATRASITQHQAIRNNMGDVSAKDGSQETCVNLIASVLGVFILTRIENSSTCTWILFFLITIFHIFANYKAVKSLKFKTLNISRLNLLTLLYLQYDQVWNVTAINQEENVLIGFGLTDYDLCGRKIYLGSSLEKSVLTRKLSADDLKDLRQTYKSKRYFIYHDNKSIHVMLQTNAVDEDIIMAYFHALALGIILNYNKLKNNGGFLRFSNCFQNILMDHSCPERSANNFVDEKWNFLKSSLKAMGWNINQHHLLISDFRIDWSI